MNSIDKIRELVPNPACVYEALVPILASCEIPSNTLERTRLGVQLSLCEFDAAHIAYPDICHNPSQLAQCTRFLETKPTWWTTFSGNYQRIPVICNELQSEFRTRHFVEVVEKVTDLLVVYEEQQKTAAVRAESAIIATMEKWNSSQNQLWTDLDQVRKLVNELALTLTQEKTHAQSELVALGTKLEVTVTNAADLSNYLNKMDTEVRALHSAISLHQQGLEVISAGHTQAAEKLHHAIDQTLTILDSTNDTLQGCETFLATLRNFINRLVYITVQFWAIMLMAIVLFYIFRRAWLTKRIEKNHQHADAIDPLFL